MSEPNIVREIAAGLDNAPELSEADYEAMEARERARRAARASNANTELLMDSLASAFGVDA